MGDRKDFTLTLLVQDEGTLLCGKGIRSGDLERGEFLSWYHQAVEETGLALTSVLGAHL